MELLRYLEAKERLAQRLLYHSHLFEVALHTLRNIVGVGVGFKNNDPARGLAVRIYVRTKIPRNLLPPSLLFEGLWEGVTLDVIALKPLKAYSRPPVVPSARVQLKPGTGARGPAGCIGCIVQDADGKRFGLSANHVLARNDSKPGSIEEFGPPGPGSLDARPIGSEIIAVTLASGSKVDCAMVSFVPGVEVKQTFPSAIGPIGAALDDMALGRQVRKLGPDGKVVQGVVADISADVELIYDPPLPQTLTIAKVTLIDDGTPAIDRKFAVAGHSGAVVFQSDGSVSRPCGLLVGGPNTDLNNNGIQEDYTAVCSLRASLAELAQQPGVRGPLQFLPPE